MDFTKFFSLIRTGKLYFPSAWQLREQDPFEGSLNVFHAKYHGVGVVGGGQDKTWFTERDVAPEGWGEKEWKLNIMIMTETRREIRKYMYINSWHMSEHESLAMWKLYDISGKGLAVVTSFERLCANLSYEKPIYIGCVKYIDYQSDETWLGNLFDPFMHKTMGLRHESEVRAVILDHREGFSDFMNSLMLKRDRQLPDPPSGVSVECDLAKLIDRVVVSPTAPAWVVNLVTDYCREAVGTQASSSSLKAEPFF
jgi:hypothetical protein